jgi:hypothetical protein
MDLVLLETVEEDDEDAAESEQEEPESDEEYDADPDVVGTWIEALNAMGADPDEDDLDYDDQWYFDQMGGDDGPTTMTTVLIQKTSRMVVMTYTKSMTPT